MSTEVLLYVQNLKHYLIENKKANEFFNVQDNEDAFFEFVSKMSQKNMDENGEPQLSLNQFEEIRKKISGEPEERINEATGYFISYGHFGYISLN